MTETELHFLSADNKIAATLCLPDGAGPFPVVLMVHGSGPLDRDENIRVSVSTSSTLLQLLCPGSEWQAFVTTSAVAAEAKATTMPRAMRTSLKMRLRW